MPYANKSDYKEYQREYQRRYRAAPENQGYRDAEQRRLKERRARARRDRVPGREPMPMPVHGPGPRKPLTPQEKYVMNCIDINSETGCWLYSAYVPDAHDDFLDGRAKRGTTRWIYELFVGPIPAGSGIYRRCGRRACVNPDHLECRDYQAEAREIILPVGQALARMREQLEAQVRVDTESDCWIWTGPLVAGGYGRFQLNDQSWMAHRVAYTLLVGPIPVGLVLDHLCRNRCCVNPKHLEPVTNKENTLRGIEYQWESAIRAELALHPHLRLPTLARRTAVPDYYAEKIVAKVRAEQAGQ